MFVMGNGVERFNKDMHSEISDRVISLFQYIKELNKLKQAARLEAYASYSEFVRRTALLEAENIIIKKEGDIK